MTTMLSLPWPITLILNPNPAEVLVIVTILHSFDISDCKSVLMLDKEFDDDCPLICEATVFGVFSDFSLSFCSVFSAEVDIELVFCDFGLSSTIIPLLIEDFFPLDRENVDDALELLRPLIGGLAKCISTALVEAFNISTV